MEKDREIGSGSGGGIRSGRGVGVAGINAMDYAEDEDTIVVKEEDSPKGGAAGRVDASSIKRGDKAIIFVQWDDIRRCIADALGQCGL